MQFKTTKLIIFLLVDWMFWIYTDIKIDAVAEIEKGNKIGFNLNQRHYILTLADFKEQK